jgi:branched-chain amino acid transport system ATP-binding protein
VLLIDELSMGLAPMVVESLFEAIARIATDQRCAIVLVEQHVNLALEIADAVAVLNHGRFVLRGSAQELAFQPELLEQAYFGVEAAGAAPG